MKRVSNRGVCPAFRVFLYFNYIYLNYIFIIFDYSTNFYYNTYLFILLINREDFQCRIKIKNAFRV